MSFRILFADDSMTAQNLGKKFLTDAGYDVVAVSNGAAAVKKIAEHKPDIIILDIYMPGYSGLEVCDKVRASVDTLKTPVLLTVGKMEPYKPEDANRVRADGVIIKPFEASDLLAVIKKLEERVVPKTVAMTQDTVLLERPPEFTDIEPEPEVHATPTATTVQGTVDVPDNMATTAAFSDMLATDPSYSLDPLPVPQPVAVVEEFSPEPLTESAQAPAPTTDSELAKPQAPLVEGWPSVPSHTEVSSEADVSTSSELVVEPATTKAERNGVGEWPSAMETKDSFVAEKTETFETPVERGFAAAEFSPLVTHHEPELVSEKQVEPEPERINASGEAPVSEAPTAIEPEKFTDPGMSMDVVTFETPVQDEKVSTSAAAVSAEESLVTAEPVQISAHEESRHYSGQQAATVEDDFEARVAAAMSIYDQPVEERVEVESSVPTEPQPVPNEVIAEAAHVVVEEVTPSFEYNPPISTPSPVETVETPVASARESQPWSASRESMLIASEATMVIPVYLERPVEQKPEEPAARAPVEVASTPIEVAPKAPAPVVEHTVPAVEESIPAVEQSVEEHVEAALPALTAAAADVAPADLGANTQMISAVVDRILERLKPQMIEEISRELKQKK